MYINRDKTGCPKPEKKEKKKIYTLKKSKPKQVSKKRAKQLKEYSPIRNKYLSENPICQCCNSAPSTEIHHVKGKTNKLLCEVKYFLAVCRDCHDYITEHSSWAIANGYSILRTAA